MQFFSNLLLIISVGVFFSCAAVERVTQPKAKSTSPEGTGPTIEQAQKEDYRGPKARVAVTRFEDKSAKGKTTGQIGDGMAEMLSNALLKTNRFIVLERGAIGDVIKEGDFGASGRVRPETAPKIGEIEGAELLIQGTITEFEPGTAGARGSGSARPPRRRGLPDIFGGITTSHVAMIVKVIEARTARILASEQVEGKATDIMGLASFGGGELSSIFGGYSKTPMEKAIRVAIEESVRLIVAKTPAEYYRVPQEPQPKKPPIHTPEPPTKPPAPAPPSPPEPPPIPKEPSKHDQRTTQVTKANENLRDGPGGNTVGQVKKGTFLVILEEKGNWLHVRLEDGREAWIWKESTSEASKKSPTPSPPKTKSPSPM
ncbi:MAG: SH3 domain-containing protein [Deltaproteobacteria bacterium]|nr:SH3 domain-containing protein [Deltaproteobacteria bacterium]